ncbi:hypothetical protein [Nocardia barduliensis]|uniref:hypothetical protein n=1 Tax=Nocardia barduliensis TaxID=2736643 RepID=UPI001571B1C5|nr:hypothetical protein [Nocardia barduliensis]
MKAAAEAEPPDRRRHIRIESGPLRLDYQASAEQAESVARALAQRFPDIRVTIDHNLCDDHPQLPCARLWD